jgi:phosphoglycolate phosphatase-like HAD superfamily hydrolase
MSQPVGAPVPTDTDATAPDPTDGDRPSYAVVDIDGVLADVRHRLRYVEGRRKDWDAFFAAAVDDEPLPQGVELANRLAGQHTIVYLTGRPERCRDDTEAWLDRHRLPAGALVLRPEGDRRPARLTKAQLLDRLSRSGVVAVVVDDDPAVCATLRAAGWPVEQADWMTRPPALDAAQEQAGRT